MLALFIIMMFCTSFASKSIIAYRKTFSIRYKGLKIETTVLCINII
jgi:hypothetical protein